MELFQHKENDQDLSPLEINAHTVRNIHEHIVILYYCSINIGIRYFVAHVFIVIIMMLF